MDWAGVARRQEERSAEAQGAVHRANEDVPVADTVLVLRALGGARGLRAELSSPLLPG